MVYTTHWWWFWGWIMALIQSLSAKQGRPSWVTSWPDHPWPDCHHRGKSEKRACSNAWARHRLSNVESCWKNALIWKDCKKILSKNAVKRNASLYTVYEGYHGLVAFPYSMTSWQSYLAGPKGKQLLPRERWEGRLGRVGERFFMPGLCFRCWDASIRPGG